MYNKYVNAPQDENAVASFKIFHLDRSCPPDPGRADPPEPPAKHGVVSRSIISLTKYGQASAALVGDLAG